MTTGITPRDASRLELENMLESLPDTRVGSIDRAYVNEVLDAGFGNFESAEMIRRFESAFADKFGIHYAISHNSGSGTMLACLLAAGVGPGDEVIVPTATMAATAFVVIQCGAVPVFADIHPQTFNINPEDVRRKITSYTRAIIPVHLFGLPADMSPIMALAKEHDLLVIEDSAQCFLAKYHGRTAGTLGHAASFSFQGSKHMTTAGDGGMLITDDEELGRNTRKAAVQGYRTLGAAAGATMIPRDERQDWSYQRHDRLGYNFRMSAVQAALGLAQLERLDRLVAARCTIAAAYEKVIIESGCDWLTPPHIPDGSTHSFWCYPCILNEEKLGVDWRTFRKCFIEHGGDGLYGMWSPVHLEPIFQSLNFYGPVERSPHHDPRYRGQVKEYRTDNCPVAETLRSRLCLFKTGMQTFDKAEQQIEALRSTIAHYANR